MQDSLNPEQTALRIAFPLKTRMRLIECWLFQAIVFIYLLRANVDAPRRRHRRRSSDSETVDVVASDVASEILKRWRNRRRKID